MINSIVFAILIAISAIFIEDAVDRYPLWFSIFFHTLMTIMIFSVISIKKLKQTYVACKQNLLMVFFMMLFSLSIYVLCFLSTALIGGSPYNTFYFAVSGFLGYLFSKDTGNNIWIAGGLGVLIALFAGYRILYVGNSFDEFLGITLAILASFSGFAYAVYSGKFAQINSLSSAQIISVRFYMLLIVSFFLLPEDTKRLITIKSMCYMFLLAVTGMALPVYFLQKGIHAIGAELNAIVVAFVPFLTLVLAAIFHGSFDIKESLFVIILTLCLLLRPVTALYKRYSISSK